MHIVPHLIIDGVDCSRYFISAHCEQTANSTKDPGKYDLVIANPGGKFTGAFAPRNLEQQVQEELGNFKIAPKRRVSLQIIVSKQGCEGSSSKTITIFSGEIQKAEADELDLRIEGSCSEGGMTSRIIPRIYQTEISVSTAVNDFLDDFGITSLRHIMPFNDQMIDLNTEFSSSIDFDTALYELSCIAQSIYFFDENDEFWFVPATDFRGFSNLSGNILRGPNASNMVGYCNHVDVYGGAIGSVNERKPHNVVYAWAEAPEIEIKERGLMRAPTVKLPTADYATCKKVADNLLEWYRQYTDVPTVKVSGKAPGLLSKVVYSPWNGSLPPVNCDGIKGAEMGAVMGLVTRRIVDISAEAGFVASLDVTPNFLGVNKPTGDEEVMNFYSKWREAINRDPSIVNKFPGVFFV